jgi:protein TonB
MRWLSREVAVGLCASIALHVALSEIEARGAPHRPAASLEVALERAPRAAPPEPPSNPLPAASPKETVQHVARAASAPSRPSPPATAAQAAHTLTAPPSAAEEVADFTMVQGEGAAYAGGTTTSRGTSTAAVRTRIVGGNGGGVAAAPGDGPSEGPDRSRRAAPEADDWRCSDLFPAAAEVDEAKVTIAVRVRADGVPLGVDTLRDPGRGFGTAARACAMRQRYVPALDREGAATDGTTRPFVVRFAR